MEFLEELITLTKNYDSPKLEEVKNQLRKEASEGKTSVTIGSNYYDEWVINYLRAQRITVEETSDQREGDFIRVTWQQR